MLNISDEYLFGPEILVAPVMDESATERRVYLPEGGWIDFWSEAVHRGPKWIEVAAPLDTLPFRSDSIDAIFLPHTLELVQDPYAVLREAERILTAEGCLMICGFNPFSGWGARRALGRLFGRPAFPPRTQRMLSERRLRD